MGRYAGGKPIQVPGEPTPADTFVAFPDEIPEPHPTADRHIHPHNFGQPPEDLTTALEG